MVQDMFSILDVQHRFLPLYGMSKDGVKLSAVQAQRARITLSRTSEAAAKAKIDAELLNRGGFIPLMGHFPVLRFGAAGRSSYGTAAAQEVADGEADAGEFAAGEMHEHPAAVSEVQQADDGVQAPAQPGPSAAAGEGSQSSGVLFTDSDKRLFVYMQQWWQRHKTAGKKRRKRSKLADGAIAAAVAAPDPAAAMQVDEPAPV